jgi:hypothetical protein
MTILQLNNNLIPKTHIYLVPPVSQLGHRIPVLLALRPVLKYQYYSDRYDTSSINRKNPYESSKARYKRASMEQFFFWLPKSRSRMTIPIQRSHNRSIFLFWCRFRHYKNCCICAGPPCEAQRTNGPVPIRTLHLGELLAFTVNTHSFRCYQGSL